MIILFYYFKLFFILVVLISLILFFFCFTTGMNAMRYVVNCTEIGVYGDLEQYCNFVLFNLCCQRPNINIKRGQNGTCRHYFLFETVSNCICELVHGSQVTNYFYLIHRFVM